MCFPNSPSISRDSAGLVHAGHEHLHDQPQVRHRAVGGPVLVPTSDGGHHPDGPFREHPQRPLG